MKQSCMIYRQISEIPFRLRITADKKKYICLPEYRKYRIIIR